MAAQYKTKCPHCQAQFRISEEHLRQAKGQVRCGSCLKVFLATKHLVDEAPAKPAPAKQPAPAKPAAKKQAAPTPENWTLPQAEDNKQAESRWTLDEEDADHVVDDFSDEQHADQEKPASNDTKVSLGSIELSDSFMSLDEDQDESLHNESFSDMAGAGRANQGDDSDESWAEKLLDELDDDKPDAEAAHVSAEKMSLSQTDEESARTTAQQKKRDRTQAQSMALNNATDEPDWAKDAGSLFEESEDGLFGDDDYSEIKEIELPRPEKPSMAPKLKFDKLISNTADILRWSALSALMLMLFSLQYLVFNFSELARTPQWRGFYTTVCSTFGCQLPNLSDIGTIRGSNLVVRAHPAFPSALVVDVLLFNKASYEQPFPMIELGFTDLAGRAIASRQFTPSEYLQGDMAGARNMPIDQPVHVSIEILDPGEHAENYTLRFFPAPEPGS